MIKLNSKKITVIASCTLLTLLLITILLSYVFRKPDINILVNFESISQEEYDHLLVNLAVSDKVKSIDRKQIKEISINAHIYHSANMKSREIKLPDLVYIIDHFDKVRSIEAGASESNNLLKDASASSTKYVIFDGSDLPESKIRQVLDNYRVTIRCTSIIGKRYELSESISQYIKFK